MPTPETEIVVDDPTAPADDSPAVDHHAHRRDRRLRCCCSRWRCCSGFDNWRSGMGWAKDGPQSGYLPFYLCVILAGASLFGLGVTCCASATPAQDVRHARPAPARRCRSSFRRFCSVAADAVARPLRRELPAGRGLHALRRAHRAGGSRCSRAFVFALVMFVTFDVAFDVIMPKGPIEALFGC